MTAAKPAIAADPLPQLLTVAEAQEVLRIGESALRRLLRSGDIPGQVRVGRKVFVNRDALERYLRGEAS